MALVANLLEMTELVSAASLVGVFQINVAFFFSCFVGDRGTGLFGRPHGGEDTL